MNLHRPAWYALVCNHTVHFRLYIILSFGTKLTHDTITILKNRGGYTLSSLCAYNNKMLFKHSSVMVDPK